MKQTLPCSEHEKLIKVTTNADMKCERIHNACINDGDGKCTYSNILDLAGKVAADNTPAPTTSGRTKADFRKA